MRNRLLAMLMLLGVATAAPAQVTIGINFSLFPELVQVPDYPVYYAPRQNANYFFYDGMYWVYQNDEWYSSDWYNGPWWRTAPEYVPEYVLRVPVRYYRRPPEFFHGWQQNAPPHWGEHWGRDWEQRRSGWDKWDRRTAPKPAPLPTYQRQYSGKRYPKVEEQRALQVQKYRYQPKDALVREHVQPQMQGPARAEREKQPEPQRKDSGKDVRERDQRAAPASQPAKKAEPAVQQQRPASAPDRQQESQRKDSGKDARERDQRSGPSNPPAQKSAPAVQHQQQQPQPTTPREQPTPRPAAQPQRPQPQAATPREQQAPKSQEKESEPRGKGASRDNSGESNRGQDKKGRD